MVVRGKKVSLCPARETDRRKIYTWLARSDLTPSMMGPPDFPDYPVPTWEDFRRLYSDTFFTPEGDGRGRFYIIQVNGEEVGTIGYELLGRRRNGVVLDIWLRAETYCGKGYGPDALETLCGHLQWQNATSIFLISLSVRNQRAIAACWKAGFRVMRVMNRGEQERAFGLSEHAVNLLMLKAL